LTSYSLEDGDDLQGEQKQRDDVESDSDVQAIECERNTAGGVELCAIQEDGLGGVSTVVSQ
jgi:hypothetical protein